MTLYPAIGNVFFIPRSGGADLRRRFFSFLVCNDLPLDESFSTSVMLSSSFSSGVGLILFVEKFNNEKRFGDVVLSFEEGVASSRSAICSL